MFRKSFPFFVFILLFAKTALSCDACGCTLSRACSEPAEGRRALFFDFNVEEQNWDAIDARAAHNLHHAGHHAHDKTHEEYYHFTLGAEPSDEWTLLAELPYVERRSLEIDDHARLGEKESSEGLGDLSLTAVYKAWRDGGSFLGPAAGIKLPTGTTDSENSAGERFEAELQPGTGSVDFSLGAAFRKEFSPRFAARGSALWLAKTEGDQGFEYGDAFSTYVILDWTANPESKRFRASVGLDVNAQVEAKQREDGVKLADSGGWTVLAGPALTVRLDERASLFGNALFPAYQVLGGVHQRIDFVTNAGFRLEW